MGSTTEECLVSRKKRAVGGGSTVARFPVPWGSEFAMVYCQRCKKNVATVHYTEIDGDYNLTAESHLCESCAQHKDLIGQAKHVSMQVLESLTAELPDQLKSLLSATCDQCGMTYAEFRSGGRLGCAHDYEVFRDGIAAVLEQVQGGQREHRGKVPRRGGRTLGLQAKLGELNEQLAEAVTLENYEHAAQLRDRIAEVEADLEKASDEGSEGTSGKPGGDDGV